MGVSSRGEDVVDVSRSRAGQLPRCEYSTDIFPTPAVAVQAVEGPAQRNHNLTLSLEPDHNRRGAPHQRLAVLDNRG